MSTKRRTKKQTIQPAITSLYFQAYEGNAATPPVPVTDSRFYVDTARELSKINRRLYQQGRCYAYQGLTFIWRATGTVATMEVSVRTSGNTWITQNAWVKGKALWDEMQSLVLDDNPSIAGKWHDYKIRLSDQQIAARTLDVKDGAGTDVKGGEWDLSTYVMPQHVVDVVTGQPLPAEEFYATLVGPDTSASRALVKAYEESRSTVQPLDPNVPAGLSASFFNLLTDSGSQEPELADVILAEGDAPPYDTDEYPGGATNSPVPLTVQYGAISAAEVDGNVGPFIAPCGLLEIEIKGYDANGLVVETEDMPVVDLLLHVAPGFYKGVAAVPMGQ
uniref:Uncharacterized protein n=1 Tax=uncultured marine virus TaxID=186617 RepID=S4TEG1_9VIRU|nr:hypothetical protein [uncultured marine virus]